VLRSVERPVGGLERKARSREWLLGGVEVGIYSQEEGGFFSVSDFGVELSTGFRLRTPRTP